MFRKRISWRCQKQAPRIQAQVRDRRNHHAQAIHIQARGRPDHHTRRQVSPTIHLTMVSLQTAARSNHPTAVPCAEKTAVSATTVLSCTDIRISGIFCCAGTTGDSTYWEFPAVTVSRNALWQICSVFPISEKALKFTFREEKADTGIVLSMSEQNNSPELQIHTTNFNYRDCPRKDIPVVFHFIL